MKRAVTFISKMGVFLTALACNVSANAAYNPPVDISNAYPWAYMVLPNGDVAYSVYNGTELDAYYYDGATGTRRTIAATSANELVATPVGSNARNDFLFISWPNLYLHDGVNNADIMMNVDPIDASWWPALGADGSVAWMQADAGSATSFDVWYRAYGASAPINISNSPDNDYGMSFYTDGTHNYILYFRTVGGTYNVMRYDIATQVTTNMTTTYGVEDVFVKNNKGDIVWLGNQGTTLSIFSAATGSVATLQATADHIFWGPRVNSFGDVAWQEFIPNDPNGVGVQLNFMAAGGVPTVVAGWTGGTMNNTNAGYDFMADDDLIYNARDAAGGEDVYVYSRTTETSTNLTNLSLQANFPWTWANDKGDVVFEADAEWPAAPGGYTGEIFVYTKATGEVERLTNDGASQIYPEIANNGRVVWADSTVGTLFSAMPIVSLPDLLVSSGLINVMGSVTTGDTVAGNFGVVNVGSGTAAATSVGLVLSTNATLGDGDDIVAGSVSITELVPGAMQYGNFSFVMDMPEGQYFLYAVADDANAVAESDETNNSFLLGGITVTNPQGSDLVVSEVKHSDTSVRRGRSFKVNSTVENQGTTNTSSTSQIDAGVYLSTDAECDLGDTRIGSWKIASAWSTLESGVSVENSAYYTIPRRGVSPGTYYVCVIADYRQKEEELDETNNGTVSSYNAGKIVVR